MIRATLPGRSVLSAALMALALASLPALAGPPPEQVPTFRLRARVTRVGDEIPTDKTFVFRLGTGAAPVTATGGEWSDWLAFGAAEVEANLRGYPAIYMAGFPVVTCLSVEGGTDPTTVEAELQFDEGGPAVPLAGELFGPRLGILLWRDAAGKPCAATQAGYNRRYWEALASVSLAARPTRFPIVDRFIGGDDDRVAWREGISSLAQAGFSCIMLPPSRPVRDLLLETGLRRTAWAVYNPPGYAFDYDSSVTPEAIQKWAADQVQPYLDAGYTRQDMAIFAMSDEPGWYYPQMIQALMGSPAGLARFRDYLKSHGLEPADVGASRWERVEPLGERQCHSIEQRRLFYWTMRFFSWDSARHFAICTRALEEAFYPGLPVLTNWNFFSGRFFVPGPVANNDQKQNPDAAMGGHDWLEFGRLRGCTMLWTEDWFSDAQAYQWSNYCARLRCAARAGGVQFGGYVIPRTAGDREDGIVQKILCVVGSGGKAIKYFVFGPEYNFPGNCYSENVTVIRKMAEAHGMIGAAEDYLWPGRPVRPQVAILMPRSSQPWDARDIDIPHQIQDATNTNLNASTVDYLAEAHDLYLALQHANVPADFLDEDDLSAQGLRPYRVLYVTEPNIPAEGQTALVRWLRNGGVLVTVTGAATHDRYNEPCNILAEATGVMEQPRERELVANLQVLAEAGRIHGPDGEVTAYGPRGHLMAPVPGVLARFTDGQAAIVQQTVGRGRLVHFCWMPGLSYARSASGQEDGLPVGFSDVLRDRITHPIRLARVRVPVTVDYALVETPVLVSEAGAALTLLNWSGRPIPRLRLQARLGFRPRSVQSVKQGPLEHGWSGDRVTLQVPLGAADIITFQR